MEIAANEIQLVPYTPMWKQFFEKESKNLLKVLRNNSMEIHHIGSTSIQKTLAKPTLDILCIVHTLDGIDLFKDEFSKLGLTLQEDNKVPGRIFFVRLAPDSATHLCHIYIFESGNSLIHDYLDFRDYLNAEDEVAKEYESLKVQLRDQHKSNPALYTAAKNEFIETVLNNLR